MSILRRRLTEGFTVISNATLEDSRLSFRARGILAFLLAKPDGWIARTEAIATQGKEGRDAVRNAVKELKDVGYYRVVTERHSNGQITRYTEVFDVAQDWVAEEHRASEARRLARKLERKLGREEELSGGAEDGYSVVGEPVAGGSGIFGSNQSEYPQEKIPPTPSAIAEVEPGEAPSPDQVEVVAVSQAPGCPTHREAPGRSCRSCGTNPRAVREGLERAHKETGIRVAREANEQVLAAVRERPGGSELSEVARARLAEMRRIRAEHADALDTTP
ncbi:hypothetical protein ACH4UT_10355 [Streptomyces sp. NPDC020799]|uniref:hypothetical protein n=1 Tax=Streptomyces sp. NPDC020799 TaxID=3365091 RepID=UPI00349B01DF